MIFAFFPRVAIKFGDTERHVYERTSLMFTEVQEIEKVTGLSYAEWEDGLRRYSITSIAALLHILRRRDGMASDFASMQFAATDLDCVPVHPDDREYTRDEIAAEITKQLEPAANGAGPTPAAADAAAAAPTETGPTPASTSPSSPNGSTSGPGNGTGSRTRTGSGARRTSTPS